MRFRTEARLKGRGAAHLNILWKEAGCIALKLFSFFGPQFSHVWDKNNNIKLYSLSHLFLTHKYSLEFAYSSYLIIRHLLASCVPGTTEGRTYTGHPRPVLGSGDSAPHCFGARAYSLACGHTPGASCPLTVTLSREWGWGAAREVILMRVEVCLIGDMS